VGLSDTQFRVVSTSARLQLALLGLISPATRPVVEPVLRGIRPQREEVLTPADAFERYETPQPLELYAQLREPKLASAA
jgi:hypothetical protein